MNRKKPAIKEAIVVEGRYDRNTLSQLIDAVIIECDGFQVFHNRETRDYILQSALETGIIVLTDADAAGFMIRSEIHGFVPGDKILDAYVPAVAGKEKRKEKPGKEGLLGVEGMKPDVILQALRDAGATFLTCRIEEHETFSETTENRTVQDPHSHVTAADLMELGITGCPGSSVRKASLLRRMNLPSHLNTKELLAVINRKMSLQELSDLVRQPDLFLI